MTRVIGQPPKHWLADPNPGPGTHPKRVLHTHADHIEGGAATRPELTLHDRRHVHVRTDVEVDAELRAQLANRHPKIARTDDRILRGVVLEDCETAVTDELDDTTAMLFNPRRGDGIEAVNEFAQCRVLEGPDRTSEARKIQNQDHSTHFTTRPRRLHIASHVAPSLFLTSLLQG